MDFQKLTPEQLRAHKSKSFAGITTTFFCHDGAGKLLFSKRSAGARDEQGAWEQGGGSLKFGVSAEDNVRREVREEYGAMAYDLEFLGYRDVFRTEHDLPTHWLALDFLVRVDPSEVTISDPKTISELGWFTLDELPQPLHSQIDRQVAIYRDRLGQL